MNIEERKAITAKMRESILTVGKPEEFPCPKCGFGGARSARFDWGTQVHVTCEYDCGPYAMNYADWAEWQDNWDETPE